MVYSLKTVDTVSVVLRTFNEEKTLFKVLSSLQKQTFQNFELIIVDNCSTDSTLKILSEFFFSRILFIPREVFNHSLSLNVGVHHAISNLVVLMNGHSIPTSKYWLESAISNFHDVKVAAVDGNYIAGSYGSFWEHLFDLKQIDTVFRKRKNLPITATNAIIRKDLWQKYQFDEQLQGCEDYDWALEMISRGYITVKEPKFNVFHSHQLSLKGLLSREKEWSSTCEKMNKKKRPDLEKENSIVLKKRLENLKIASFSNTEFKLTFQSFLQAQDPDLRKKILLDILENHLVQCHPIYH